VVRAAARQDMGMAASMGMPPTGREVTLTRIDILRVVDGKIVEGWGEFDGIEMCNGWVRCPSPASG
jgi:predicted ester cyclase